MRVEERVLVTNAYHGNPVENRQFSIKDINLAQLIEMLREMSIDINLKYSQQRREYQIHTRLGMEPQKITAVLPLEATLQDSSPQAYYLRDGEGLELELTNYEHITQRPSEETLGGPISGEFGIQCKIVIEGEEVDLSIVDRVRSTLYKTAYRESIVRELGDFKFHIN